MFNSMSSWLGLGKEDTTKNSDENKENIQTEEKGKVESDEKPTTEPSEGNQQEGDGDIDVSLDAAKHKLKEWGNFLYSFSKEAGKTVADQAKKITKTVEDHTLLGDFSKEQEKFVTEKKETAKKSEAAVPPWVGYDEEESMKSQILALSTDKRNFVRNPPAGVQFQFDFEASHPVAMATLQEDKNLQKMRFDLVPKQVKEEIFWRNYFYRVSLIKQSTELTSLAQENGSSMGSRTNSTGSFKSSDDNQEKDKDTSAQNIKQKSRVEDEIPSSPTENEFVSDTFQSDEITDEDLKKEMQQLRVKDQQKHEKEEEVEGDIKDWENELQNELKEYEMVTQEGDVLDDELENEILQEIENETNNM